MTSLLVTGDAGDTGSAVLIGHEPVGCGPDHPAHSVPRPELHLNVMHQPARVLPAPGSYLIRWSDP